VSHSGTSRVVLVVEDEWAVRYLIALQLLEGGWDVLQATTAEDAIECLQRGDRVDIVFTDIQLTGVLNGWDVAEQFRAVRADMPIIYTSANSVDRSRRVVGSMFYEKPYRPAAIVEACEKLAEEWL
jgi:CheY-like chemotaxis protein